MGELRVWIEPGLAENWLPKPGDGYTIAINDGEPLRGVVTGTQATDGGLWVHLKIEGPYLADVRKSA